ncbi:MAG TPA: hydrogenase maturation protease [Solirubrobacteraceae bacterium]|nr:hydrogenase maturation protease [Solirubrobacteraceae bacterium]
MSDVPSYWEELERPGPDAVTVDGVQLRARSRVRLRPRAGGDVLDLALAGRTAVVEGIEQDLEGNLKLAVAIDDDPGRDLGLRRQPGHRFFFSPEEVEPLDGGAPVAAPAGRVLVAGIGNVFLGDDGFGVALADRLARRALPAGVEVVDYGIRGMDLAYALHDGWDAVLLLDATPRGGPPGTLYVVEPDPAEGAAGVDAHGMDPLRVLALARALGGPLPRILVVGCEPQTVMRGDEEDVVAAISEPVRAALDEAVALVERLLAELTSPDQQEGVNP